MAGNDFGVVIGQRQHAISCGDDTFRAATAGNIDERIPAIEKCIAHVNHVALLELHDGVAVGMRVGHMKAEHFITIEMKGYIGRKCHDG